MVQHFLLKSTQIWQRFTLLINCRIYGANLFAAGMTGGGLTLAVIYYLHRMMQFRILLVLSGVLSFLEMYLVQGHLVNMVKYYLQA
ncbi:hypothetical protein AWF69_26105 [Escherichia coli]|nr:hypothetical protein BCV59_26575 [Escherichia coli]KUW76183.1 hypothetical protein AWF69_26105 [Escherichia coli]OIZ80595.1 hypothetical protein BM751_21775 [Escherichia coli]DAS07672.1 MAG TPA: hypothetical protein [Caudoviricetes sp.]